MRKRLRFTVVALALGALMAWSHVRPEQAVARSCFVCDWYTGGDGIQRHYDCFLVLNTLEGFKHPCGGGTYGGCWQHSAYVSI